MSLTSGIYSATGYKKNTQVALTIINQHNTFLKKNSILQIWTWGHLCITVSHPEKLNMLWTTSPKGQQNVNNKTLKKYVSHRLTFHFWELLYLFCWPTNTITKPMQSSATAGCISELWNPNVKSNGQDMSTLNQPILLSAWNELYQNLIINWIIYSSQRYGNNLFIFEVMFRFYPHEISCYVSGDDLSHVFAYSKLSKKYFGNK